MGKSPLIYLSMEVLRGKKIVENDDVVELVPFLKLGLSYTLSFTIIFFFIIAFIISGFIYRFSLYRNFHFSQHDCMRTEEESTKTNTEKLCSQSVYAYRAGAWSEITIGFCIYREMNGLQCLKHSHWANKKIGKCRAEIWGKRWMEIGLKKISVKFSHFFWNNLLKH